MTNHNTNTAKIDPQKYYKEIITVMPGHVYWKDKEGRFLGCNLEQALDAGFTNVDDIVGKTDKDMPWAMQAEYLRKNDLSVMQSQRSVTLEEPFELPDGTKKVYLSRKMPLHDEFGKVSGILGISVDITELKNTQDKLKKTEGRLDGMLLLSSSMAHELRTPLTAISITVASLRKYLDLLIHKYQQSRQENDDDYISDTQLSLISNSLDNILSSTRGANQFINMILTNLSSEKEDIGKHNCCSIKECLELCMTEYAFPTGYIAKVDTTGVKDFLFYGDQNLTKHIFFNLFKNAFYFIDKAGKGEITIWTTENSDYHQLHFKDTGTGIAPEKIPKIFERFFTADTHHGTGIGLAFCKLVMEAIGGEIACESELGEYAEFILSFPKVD